MSHVASQLHSSSLDESALVTLLEAIYSLEVDDETWLRQVLSATRALAGPEHAYVGFFYDASRPEGFAVWNVCSVACPPELEEGFRLLQETVHPEFVRATLRTLHVGSARRTGMPEMASVLAHRESVGWGDIFNVNGLDPSGIGCVLTIGTRERVCSPPPEEMVVYSRIAQHLAAAFRCRRLLGLTQTPGHARTPESPRGTAEAVLDFEGRLVHAESEPAEAVDASRGRLGDAERAIARARRGGRRAGRAALETWHPLVDARWTLVDSFEESGRRYLVARENQSAAWGVDRLTDRERQVVTQAALGFTNKEIAYELGISDSTVRVLMARAAARLGVRSRAEILAHPALGEVGVDRRSSA